MSRFGWVLVGVLAACAEIALIVTHPEESKATARAIYQTLWKYAPRPEGMESYQPPDRFR
jgi:hypothetical protein